MNSAGAAGSIRLLLADDDQVVLANVAKMLAPAEDIVIIGMANDADQAVAMASDSDPDVVLTDVNMPLGGGLKATEGIRAASPRTHVVAHSVYEDRGAVMQMVRAGAIGYIVKGAPSAELLAVIRRAARGEASLSDSITSTVINELAALLRQKEQAADSHRARQATFRRFAGGQGMRVLFQPVLDLAGGAVIGYEALARFDEEPARNPREWFVEAGAVGFRLEIELAAVRLALASLDRLPASLFLEINISPDTVISDELDRLVDGLAAGRLVIDLSARDIPRDYPSLQDRLSRLRRRGIRVAIDDLGAEDAHVRHLLELAPEVVKLDTAVIQAMGGRPAFKAFARSMVAFGRETGAILVAEGVEQPDELELSRSLGINWAQGFLFGAPGTLEPPAAPGQP